MIKECCICGGAVETKKILPFRDLIGAGVEIWNMHIGICPKCGFIFNQTPLTAAQLESRYKKNSRYEFDSKTYILGGNPDYKARSLRQKHFIDEQISETGVGYNSILEIGAASGYNLSLYADKQRLGIEPSEGNCRSAKKLYGVDMFNGMFDEFIASNDQTFDLIFTSHVLEHIVDPMKFIEQCASICNRYIFIEVPCLDIKFVDDPMGVFFDEHVNFFTIQSLWHLMRRAGFSPVEMEMNLKVHYYSRPVSAPVLTTLWIKDDNPEPIVDTTFDASECLDKYLAINEKLMQAFDAKINAIPNDEKLALYGAGYKLAMFLANTPSLLKKNIVRIYDSDRRKHGHKMCGVTVKPFEPNDVSSGAIDSILITAYSGQRAIKKYIDSFGLPIKVYTLYNIP